MRLPHNYRSISRLSEIAFFFLPLRKNSEHNCREHTGTVGTGRSACRKLFSELGARDKSGWHNEAQAFASPAYIPVLTKTDYCFKNTQTIASSFIWLTVILVDKYIVVDYIRFIEVFYLILYSFFKLKKCLFARHLT